MCCRNAVLLSWTIKAFYSTLSALAWEITSSPVCPSPRFSTVLHSHMHTVHMKTHIQKHSFIFQSLNYWTHCSIVNIEVCLFGCFSLDLPPACHTWISKKRKKRQYEVFSTSLFPSCVNKTEWYSVLLNEAWCSTSTMAAAVFRIRQIFPPKQTWYVPFFPLCHICTKYHMTNILSKQPRIVLFSDFVKWKTQ